ncbi:hypothetical protein SAE01_47880 [Segetibacter aerophilus]|uniref:Uncharacterized protein n=2 Tax=Segetibacter aerophilus TaxID=670293 RepID=A0A512BK06_9BACT|nr:hypothetical protein SAE01_47880 [Segetibacter aerophilus]
MDAEMKEEDKQNIVFSKWALYQFLKPYLLKYESLAESVVIDTAEGLYQNKIYQ